MTWIMMKRNYYEMCLTFNYFSFVFKYSAFLLCIFFLLYFTSPYCSSNEKILELQYKYIAHSFISHYPHEPPNTTEAQHFRPPSPSTVWVVFLQMDGWSMVWSRIWCLFLIHPIYRKHSSTDHLSSSIKGLFLLTSRPMDALLSL